MAQQNAFSLILSWAAACGLPLVPVAGLCYTWDYAPTIGTGVAYETNPYYNSESSLEDDAYSAFLDASLMISAETGRNQMNFRPRVRISLYTGTENATDLNATDYYLPLDATWLTQRARYSVNGGYSRISTRNSEVFVTDPNDSGQTGSSGRVVSVDENQERGYLSPSAGFQISERDLLNLSLSVDDVTYTKAELTNRSNYVYGSTSASWTHSLSPKGRITGTVNLDEFKADQPDSPTENDTVSYGIDAGYEYSLSELTTLGLTAGTSQSDVDVTGLATVDDANGNPIPCRDPQTGDPVLCELKASEKNFVGRAFYRQKNAETITTEFSISRSLQPNSDGAQVTQDSLNAYITKEFAPRLSGRLGATYIRQKAVGGSVAGSRAQRFDREYSRLDASLSWTIARTWFLDAGYGFSHDQQKSGATYTTDNHTLSLQLRYAGLGRH